MSPTYATVTEQEAARRYLRLVGLAETRGLSQPPPYSDHGANKAWQNGYDCALRDLASGKLGGNRAE